MARSLFLLSSLALVLAACNNPADRPKVSSDLADNVQVEVKTVTPDVPLSTSATDTQIMQDIRQEMIADTALSPLARNITITTTDGVVTLRGTVANDAEKTAIGRIAQHAKDVKSVDNLLEVHGQ